MAKKMVDGKKNEKGPDPDEGKKKTDQSENGKKKKDKKTDEPTSSCSSSCSSSSSTLESRVRSAFGFSWKDFRSWNAASTLMFAPRDPAALGVFRILFGFAMLHDVFNERHMSDLANVWHNERMCYFTLFDFVEPLPLNWMFVIHLLMALGALCIALGFFFHYAIWLHILPYWYVFFLDKTTWNNHTYLFGLVSTMLSFTSANHYYSLDAVMNPSLSNKHVPAWNYGLFRFQFIIVYFIAGLKKWTDMDWMHGWSMGKLSKHWVFKPFTAIIPPEVVNFVIVHVGGATLDLIGGWLLFFDLTRPLGIFLVQQFHLMNAQMFSIGMFPYVMLCTTPIFCYPDWPRKLSYRIKFLLFKAKLMKVEPSEPEMPVEVFNERCIYPKEVVKSEEKRQSLEEEEVKKEEVKKEVEEKKEDSSDAKTSVEKKQKEVGKTKSSPKKNPKKSMILRSLPTKSHHIATTLVCAWMAWQLILPYSHSITQGYNAWTEGLYGYSWDMMIKTWSTQHVRVSFKDMSTGEVGYLNPDIITEGSGNRWSSHPDMVKQFTKCVQRKFAEFNFTDFQLHFDIWRSMTKRFQQRMFDPRVDLIAADWSPFAAPSWVMPVLSDLADWRGRLVEIEKQKRDEAEGNEDLVPSIVFAADFPGLFLENYINEGLDNTTVELLQGEIEIEFIGLDGDDGEPEEEDAPPAKPHVLSELAKSGKNVTLNTPGQIVLLPHGEYHRIHTIGSKPSCYMFVYENTTNKAEFKKEMANKKKFERMMNTSKEEPVSEGGRNFSNAAVVAEFFGDELKPELVEKFAEKFHNITLAEEEKKARTMGGNMLMVLFLKIQEKFYKQVARYGKALWQAYLSLKSIWEGRSLEEVFKEINEAAMKEEEENNNNNNSTTNTDNEIGTNDDNEGRKVFDDPTDNGDELKDDAKMDTIDGDDSSPSSSPSSSSRPSSSHNLNDDKSL